MMDSHRRTAIAMSPGVLSQASCGSPYDSEFTSGSPGQCSLGSENSMSPSQLSPGALQLKFGFFDNMTVFSSSQPDMPAAPMFPANPSHRSSVETAPRSASPLSSFGADPPTPSPKPFQSTSYGGFSVGTPEALLEHYSKLQEAHVLSSMTLPSNTIDADATLTPYSDATRTKKPAKEGKVKRPMNPFMIWSQLQRRRITAEKPEMHNAEISKQLGQLWKTMTESAKEPFRTESKRLKALHQVEFPTYKYKPRKNKHKVQNKPVKTESGRVSKPRNRDSAKPAAAKSRKGVGSRRKPKSAATTTTSLGVSPEVSSSLVSMLQASPRFQPILSPESVTAAAMDSGSAKQFSRLIIRDNNCIRDVVDSPPLPPSSSEVTASAEPADVFSMYAATPQAFNPAFRPNDLLTTTATTATHHRLFPTAADAVTSEHSIFPTGTVTSEHNIFPTDTGAGEHIFPAATSEHIFPTVKSEHIFSTATSAHIFSTVTSEHNVFPAATDTSEHNIFHTATIQHNVDIPEEQIEVDFPSESEVRKNLKLPVKICVGDNIYTEYEFGASVVYNLLTKEYTFKRLAEITEISDLVDVTGTIKADWPVNGLWDPDSLSKLTDKPDYITDSDIQNVPHHLPDDIFAESRVYHH